MNGLDLLIGAAVLTAVVVGFRLGFVTRAISWFGLIVGIIGGSMLLPLIIDGFDDRIDRANLIVVAAGVVVGAGVLGQAVGFFVGSRLRIAIPAGRARSLDAAAGALAGAVGVMAVVWLVAPAMVDVPEWPAEQARGSAVVGAVDRVLPDAPDTSQSVRRLLGDPFPQVFDSPRRSPELGPPPASSELGEESTDRIAASTVLVTGQACGRTQEGSGFVVDQGLVATNAHVVAGQELTEVITTDGTRRRGEVVAFDSDRDLAMLRVDDLDRPPLPLGDAGIGDVGAVFGYPGGDPLRLAPFEVGERVTAQGADIYDRTGVERDVLVLASDLSPGDSGAALVSPGGEVLGVAFAIAPDRSGVAYALSTDELRAVLDTVSLASVPAGACLV
ncbi:MarP family serine protease [soil metagenome]